MEEKNRIVLHAVVAVHFLTHPPLLLIILRDPRASGSGINHSGIQFKNRILFTVSLNFQPLSPSPLVASDIAFPKKIKFQEPSKRPLTFFLNFLISKP
ncbi:hypothetical protein CDL12_15808 [Handroanthus impetiginosus]|uniref:Uncharacterized protein n=1 Tax=Handroanthus impetiginosus TaxID=429701 RepID=A0A2G9H235_9LAMI|nr:hypothetical protein CDL12_15808 [Handroanthus impetiginosus]